MRKEKKRKEKKRKGKERKEKKRKRKRGEKMRRGLKTFVLGCNITRYKCSHLYRVTGCFIPVQYSVQMRVMNRYKCLFFQ
jgi:hypothetical protein